MSVGGVIVSAATPIIAVGFGREWWAAEAIRADTDWPGVVDTALEIMVAAGVIRPEQSTFELACEQADRKRQPHPSRQEVA